MANTYFDHTGREIVLDGKIKKGGEGAVFNVRSNRQVVAKVYNDPVSNEKAAKLAAMLRLPSDELKNCAAWPCATLHQFQGGPTVGIIIPRIDNAREIH